jgi:hypothetical protein
MPVPTKPRLNPKRYYNEGITRELNEYRNEHKQEARVKRLQELIEKAELEKSGD